MPQLQQIHKNSNDPALPDLAAVDSRFHVFVSVLMAHLHISVHLSVTKSLKSTSSKIFFMPKEE